MAWEVVMMNLVCHAVFEKSFERFRILFVDTNVENPYNYVYTSATITQKVLFSNLILPVLPLITASQIRQLYPVHMHCIPVWPYVHFFTEQCECSGIRDLAKAYSVCSKFILLRRALNYAIVTMSFRLMFIFLFLFFCPFTCLNDHCSFAGKCCKRWSSSRVFFHCIWIDNCRNIAYSFNCQNHNSKWETNYSTIWNNNS